MKRITLAPEAKPHEWLAWTAKEFNAQGRLPAMANTPNVDRHREVVLPSAFKGSLSEFRKNPVLLSQHQHRLDSGEPSVIGLVHNIKITPEGLPFEAGFVPAELYPAGAVPLGAIHENLFRERFLRAFSIGFIIEAGTVFEGEDELKELIAELTPEMQRRIIRAFRGKVGRRRPFAVITLAELLEISAVAVPSNRESLVQASARGIPGASEALRWLEQRAFPEDFDADVHVRSLRYQLVSAEVAMRSQPEAIREWCAAQLRTLDVEVVCADDVCVAKEWDAALGADDGKGDVRDDAADIQAQQAADAAADDRREKALETEAVTMPAHLAAGVNAMLASDAGRATIAEAATLAERNAAPDGDDDADAPCCKSCGDGGPCERSDGGGAKGETTELAAAVIAAAERVASVFTEAAERMTAASERLERAAAAKGAVSPGGGAGGDDGADEPRQAAGGEPGGTDWMTEALLGPVARSVASIASGNGAEE